MQFQYGAPPQRISAYPPCHAKSYDDMSGECRRCGFQNSCKDEIIRQNVIRPLAPYPAYGGPTPTTSYAVPQPVRPVLYSQPQGVQRPPAVPVAQDTTRLAQMMMPMTQGQQPPYGWLQDPLYYSMAATPPPVRPQMQGEAFWERIMKNAGLAMVEALFGQCFLAVRQLILPPIPKGPRSGGSQTPGQ